MKKSKLIVGILLMILGIGVSSGSVVLRYYEHHRYGMLNHGNKIVNRRGMMGGFGLGGVRQRRFNVNPNPNPGQSQPPKSNPNPNKGQNSNTNPQPDQNQNQGQNSNGGVSQ